MEKNKPGSLVPAGASSPFSPIPFSPFLLRLSESPNLNLNLNFNLQTVDFKTFDSSPPMKPTILLLTLAAGCIPPVLRAQDQAPAGGASTRIPGPVEGGRFVPPPPPPPPKPVPADMRVESAFTRQSPGGSLGILRGSPSTLPDIPAPAPPPPLTAEQAALREAFRASHRPPVRLVMGASSFILEDGTGVSLLQWRHPENPEVGYEAALPLHAGIFESVGDFLHEGIPHSLFLLHDETDLRALKGRAFGTLSARLGPLAASLPAIPAEGFLILKGDPGDAAGTAPVRALMDLHAVEKERLAAAFTERRQARRDAAEWARRNAAPPAPAHHRYWLRPHRNSRYLPSSPSQPQPENP